MSSKTITYNGADAIRLPVGVTADRAEDDDRPGHYVEAGDSVTLAAELADVLLDREDWTAAPKGSRSRGSSGAKMTKDEGPSSDEEV